MIWGIKLATAEADIKQELKETKMKTKMLNNWVINIVQNSLC